MNIESELLLFLRKHRERKTPEFIRKLMYIFDLKKILDLIFTIQLGISIFSWLYHLWRL